MSDKYINLDVFDKSILRTAQIINVIEIEKSNKLLLFTLKCGERTINIVSGIREYYSDLPDLKGRYVVILSNLEPRKIMGHYSEGMILTVENNLGKVSILFSPDELEDNAKVL